MSAQHVFAAINSDVIRYHNEWHTLNTQCNIQKSSPEKVLFTEVLDKKRQNIHIH